MRELHLFAGAGGGILGGILLGHTCVCAVEIEPYCRKVLLQRQRDGILPRFPIWDDIRTFDGSPWRGLVDVVCGGFPCQDISAAGKGEGINGSRSGLWSEMARIIREVGPRFVFVENSPVLTSRGLGRVLGDLAEMGYDARWCVLGADDAGAPHIRKRIWILAYAKYRGMEIGRGTCDASQKGPYSGRVEWPDSSSSYLKEGKGMAHPNQSGLSGNLLQGFGIISREEESSKRSKPCGGDAAQIGRKSWPAEPELGRVANGVAHRVDRLKAIGNGQVPAVAALAWNTLIDNHLTQPQR